MSRPLSRSGRRNLFGEIRCYRIAGCAGGSITCWRGFLVTFVTEGKGAFDTGILRGMGKLSSERVLLVTAGCLLALGIALSLVSGGSLHGVARVLRWMGVVALMVLAGRRRSVTPWIFVAMVAGAGVGFDAPAVAVGLRVFSDIFLRLIKTVVAPPVL